jgi:hypothetical protein
LNKNVRTVRKYMFLPPKATWNDIPVASLYERVASHVIDVLLQAALQLALLVALAWEDLVQMAGELAGDGLGIAQILEVLNQDGRSVLYSVLIGWVLGGVYEASFTRLLGGSIGKLLLGIEVREIRNGGRLSWARAFGRWLGLGWMAPAGAVAPAGQFIPFFGYGLAWFDPRRRALHDMMCGAIVVPRTPRGGERRG